MKIMVRGFEDGGEIPRIFTCDGVDESPEVSWIEIPEEAKSLALIMDDPDAPMGTFTHWIIYNVDPGTKGLTRKLPRTESLDFGPAQGKNDFGKIGYGGPCPPHGRPHRYFFRLYALSSDSAIEPGVERNELEKKIKKAIMEEASYMGKYRRS